MYVKELIDRLQNFAPNANVYVAIQFRDTIFYDLVLDTRSDNDGDVVLEPVPYDLGKLSHPKEDK